MEDSFHADQRAFRVHVASVSAGATARPQHVLFVRAAGPAFLDALNGHACLLTQVGQVFARFLRSREVDEVMDCEEFLMALYFLRCGKSKAEWMRETRASFDDFGWPRVVENFVFHYLQQSGDAECGDPNPWQWWGDEAAKLAEAVAVRDAATRAAGPVRRASAAAQAAARAAAFALDGAFDALAAASVAAAQRASDEELTRRRAQLQRDAALATAESDARWDEFQRLGRRLTAGLATALGAVDEMDGAGEAHGSAGALSTLLEESDVWSDDGELSGAAGADGSSLWQPPTGVVADVADTCQVRRAVARGFVRLARRRGATSTAQCVEVLIAHGGVLPTPTRVEDIEGETVAYEHRSEPTVAIESDEAHGGYAGAGRPASKDDGGGGGAKKNMP